MSVTAKPESKTHVGETARRLKIGVIGAGRRGRISKHAHQPENGSVLAAACDISQDILDEYAAEFGSSTQLTKDYRELLRNPELDAVFICTPDFLHEEHALAALEAGKDVYLEKPMTISVEGCDRVLRKARELGRKVAVGHNMRFFPVMLKMKQLIDSGEIGQVQAIWCRHFISYGGDAYFKDWHSEQRYSNGLLLQKGAHDIDMIHWFGGAHTARTVGMGKLSVYNQVKDRRAEDEPYPSVAFNRENWPPLTQKKLSPIIDVEDHSMVLLQLANGVQANYVQCHYTPDDQRNYTIIGTEGRIENCGDHSSENKMATVRLWKWRCGYEEQGTEAYKIPYLAGGHGGADPQIINDFLHYVRTGEQKGATALDARMSVAAGCMATRSLREGNTPFDIPPIEW